MKIHILNQTMEWQVWGKAFFFSKLVHSRTSTYIQFQQQQLWDFLLKKTFVCVCFQLVIRGPPFPGQGCPAMPTDSDTLLWLATGEMLASTYRFYSGNVSAHGYKNTELVISSVLGKFKQTILKQTCCSWKQSRFSQCSLAYPAVFFPQVVVLLMHTASLRHVIFSPIPPISPCICFPPVKFCLETSLVFVPLHLLLICWCFLPFHHVSLQRLYINSSSWLFWWIYFYVHTEKLALMELLSPKFVFLFCFF